jgi:hypothetical protein
MTREQFNLIHHFTAGEVEATGARISDVNFRLLLAYDTYRGILGVPVQFVKDGIITGEHAKNPGPHKDGIAGDSCFLKSTPAIETIFRAGLQSGFRGIGIYWNGKAYSVHLDLREQFAFWSATKKKDGSWNYGKLLNLIDPRKL